MPAHDLPEPFPLFGYGPVQPTPQLLLDGPELRPHAVAAGLPLKLEAPAARCATDEREPEEHEGLRFAKPALLAVDRSTAAKLNHTGLVRMEWQFELLKPRAHRIEKATLPLSENNIERQGALARTAHPSDDHEFAARNLDGKILEIVLARAMHRDHIVA